MKKSYAKLLKNSPAHGSPEFIDYLRENNKVVFESPIWIVIENYKYHTKEKPWLTAFYKGTFQSVAIHDVPYLYKNFDWKDWNWLKKSADKQTVPGRFHIHIYK